MLRSESRKLTSTQYLSQNGELIRHPEVLKQLAASLAALNQTHTSSSRRIAARRSGRTARVSGMSRNCCAQTSPVTWGSYPRGFALTAPGPRIRLPRFDDDAS